MRSHRRTQLLYSIPRSPLSRTTTTTDACGKHSSPYAQLSDEVLVVLVLHTRKRTDADRGGALLDIEHLRGAGAWSELARHCLECARDANGQRWIGPTNRSSSVPMWAQSSTNSGRVTTRVLASRPTGRTRTKAQQVPTKSMLFCSFSTRPSYGPQTMASCWHANMRQPVGCPHGAIGKRWRTVTFESSTTAHGPRRSNT